MGSHGSATGSMILVLSFLAALLHPSAGCIPAERTALLAFKAGIKADPQGLLSRWTANGDCCSWGSTFCDSTGHITQVFLSPDPAFDDDTYYLKGTVESTPTEPLLRVFEFATKPSPDGRRYCYCRHNFTSPGKAHAPPDTRLSPPEAALWIATSSSRQSEGPPVLQRSREQAHRLHSILLRRPYKPHVARAWPKSVSINTLSIPNLFTHSSVSKP